MEEWHQKVGAREPEEVRLWPGEWLRLWRLLETRRQVVNEVPGRARGMIFTYNGSGFYVSLRLQLTLMENECQTRPISTVRVH